MESITRKFPIDAEHAAFDLIIIGAGINGAGIARDAAMRGLNVLLLDKGDIASGTTSWSSRLIHGGLRYLEYGEIGLVRESLRERERLFRTAPHLVKPLPMMIPIYSTSKRGVATIRAGMLAYDVLSFDKSLDHHHMLSVSETMKRAPGLNPDGLRGAALYYDAQVEFAERLAVENCLSAVRHGATVLTYAKVTELLIEGDGGGGGVRGIKFIDLFTGDEYTAHAPVTLNVAGPWVDQMLTNLKPPSQPMIGGTKGSHIVVHQFAGAPQDALYVEAQIDHRPFFIIPWNNHLLIGTTDTRFEGDLDHVAADEQEISYLLQETNHVIPTACLTRDSVLFTYSGVRPLPFINNAVESGITRRHFVHQHSSNLDGLLSVVGGKLTTYRSLAEHAVDLLYKALGRKAPRCVTADAPLPGAATDDFTRFSEAFVKQTSGVPEATARRLLRVYGTRAQQVLELAGEDAELLQPLTAGTDSVRAEVLMSFRREGAQTLADCLLRRTMLGMNHRVGRDVAHFAAKVAGQYLGWSSPRVEQEVAAYRTYTERFHPQHHNEPLSRSQHPPSFRTDFPKSLK